MQGQRSRGYETSVRPSALEAPSPPCNRSGAAQRVRPVARSPEARSLNREASPVEVRSPRPTRIPTAKGLRSPSPREKRAEEEIERLQRKLDDRDLRVAELEGELEALKGELAKTLETAERRKKERDHAEHDVRAQKEYAASLKKELADLEGGALVVANQLRAETSAKFQVMQREISRAFTAGLEDLRADLALPAKRGEPSAPAEENEAGDEDDKVHAGEDDVESLARTVKYEADSSGTHKDTGGMDSETDAKFPPRNANGRRSDESQVSRSSLSFSPSFSPSVPSVKEDTHKSRRVHDDDDADDDDETDGKKDKVLAGEDDVESLADTVKYEADSPGTHKDAERSGKQAAENIAQKVARGIYDELMKSTEDDDEVPQATKASTILAAMSAIQKLGYNKVDENGRRTRKFIYGSRHDLKERSLGPSKLAQPLWYLVMRDATQNSDEYLESLLTQVDPESTEISFLTAVMDTLVEILVEATGS